MGVLILMQKVFGYVRVSTPNQAREGYSLGYQAEEIKRYCEQNNFELIHIFSDAGVSGAKVDEDGLTVDRPALQEMLAELQSQCIKLVVCLNTSRLWRSDTAKILIQRVMKKNSVDIRAIEQPTYSIYGNDPSNILINGIMELLDEYARLEIALKLSRGRKKKAGQGLYAGGGIVYGYKSVKANGIIEIDEEQAKAVRLIFELRSQSTGYSLSQIASRVNYEGFLTEKGKPFTKVQILRVLSHASFYKGFYKYGDCIETKGQHQAIL